MCLSSIYSLDSNTLYNIIPFFSFQLILNSTILYNGRWANPGYIPFYKYRAYASLNWDMIALENFLSRVQHQANI